MYQRIHDDEAEFIESNPQTFVCEKNISLIFAMCILEYRQKKEHQKCQNLSGENFKITETEKHF